MGMVLWLVFAFRVLIFFLGGREQFVENTGRELFSQHRPVGDNAIGVVNKRYAVDSACGIDPEYSVNTVCFEQLPELVPRIVRAHGIFDCLSQPVERHVQLQRALRPLVILLKGLVADIPSNTTRFEGRADAIAVVGQGTVDNTCIISAIDSSRALLDRNVEQFQQGAEFAVGRAFITIQTGAYNGRDLLLDVAFPVVYPMQSHLAGLLLPLDTRMQINYICVPDRVISPSNVLLRNRAAVYGLSHRRATIRYGDARARCPYV